MSRQEQSPKVGVAVEGMPRDGEVKQEHSILALSFCEELLDVFSFRGELYETAR